MIRIYICFLLCLFFESSFSQSRRFYDNNDYKKQRHEINFGLGVSSCQTDVGGSQYNDQELSEKFGGTIFRSLYDTDLSSSNFALNAAYVYHYKNRINFRGNLIFSRKQENGFVDVAIIKQRIRDLIDPDRNLGHVDNVR